MGRVKAGSLRLEEAAELLELSYREAGVGAVSGRRGQGLAARQLRAKVEPCVPGRVSAEGAGARRAALRGFRSDAGERAPGQRGRTEDSCREFAAVDARSRSRHRI